jgi:hypothetical protein
LSVHDCVVAIERFTTLLPFCRLICDECVDLCTGIVEPDDDNELFRLMKGTGECEARAEPAAFDLAHRASTKELAEYVEHGRKGVERNRVAVDGIQRRLDGGDDIPPSNKRNWLSSKTREELIMLQQKAQRELRPCLVSAGTR